jgi:hypothetical protein
MARVDGKPKMVSERYLGSGSDPITATRREATPEPPLTELRLPWLQARDWRFPSLPWRHIQRGAKILSHQRRQRGGGARRVDRRRDGPVSLHLCVFGHHRRTGTRGAPKAIPTLKPVTGYACLHELPPKCRRRLCYFGSGSSSVGRDPSSRSGWPLRAF